MKKYEVSQLNEINPMRCPCGYTRRAFAALKDGLASVHLLAVEADAKVHYHRKLTEIYIILEGEGNLELDGELIPIKPMTAVMIKPGCRHRAIGKLQVINVVIPTFDPQDEWFD